MIVVRLDIDSAIAFLKKGSCPHENGDLNVVNNKIVCAKHGGKFQNNGKGIDGDPYVDGLNLIVYKGKVLDNKIILEGL